MELTHREKPPPPLPTQKAADVVGVHPNTLRRWEAEGRIKAVRLPSGQRRWDYQALMQLRESSVET